VTAAERGRANQRQLVIAARRAGPSRDFSGGYALRLRCSIAAMLRCRPTHPAASRRVLCSVARLAACRCSSCNGVWCTPSSASELVFRTQFLSADVRIGCTDSRPASYEDDDTPSPGRPLSSIETGRRRRATWTRLYVARSRRFRNLAVTESSLDAPPAPTALGARRPPVRVPLGYPKGGLEPRSPVPVRVPLGHPKGGLEPRAVRTFVPLGEPMHRVRARRALSRCVSRRSSIARSGAACLFPGRRCARGVDGESRGDAKRC
jgi:hypothetical protein